MFPTQVATLSIFIVLGTCVVASYSLLFKSASLATAQIASSNAAVSPTPPAITGVQKYWFGIERPIQYVYLALMVCAAAGLCAVTAWYCGLPELPTRGILKHGWVMPVLYSCIMGFSALWSFAVSRAVPSAALVATSLIGTAVSSIFVLAGVMESDTRTWYAFLGATAFATVTVLSDSVGWLANYLVS